LFSIQGGQPANRVDAQTHFFRSRLSKFRALQTANVTKAITTQHLPVVKRICGGRYTCILDYLCPH